MILHKLRLYKYIYLDKINLPKLDIRTKNGRLPEKLTISLSVQICSG